MWDIYPQGLWRRVHTHHTGASPCGISGTSGPVQRRAGWSQKAQGQPARPSAGLKTPDLLCETGKASKVCRPINTVSSCSQFLAKGKCHRRTTSSTLKPPGVSAKRMDEQVRGKNRRESASQADAGQRATPAWLRPVPGVTYCRIPLKPRVHVTHTTAQAHRRGCTLERGTPKVLKHQGTQNQTTHTQGCKPRLIREPLPQRT